MTASEPISEPAQGWAATWIVRLRFAAAIAIGWWVLLLIEPLLLPRGMNRPLMFIAAPGLASGILSLAIAVSLAYGGSLLAGRRFPGVSLLIFSLLLALWCSLRGTMDDWLILTNPAPGPGRSLPYLLLIGDYAMLAAAIAALLRAEGLLQSGPDTGSWVRPGLGAPSEGALATAAGTLTAAIVIFFLAGPAFSGTLRGQVWFALFIGFWVAVVVGRRVAPNASTIWFLAIPLAVGMLGAILCAARPVLPAPFQNVNIIPAWRGLGRAIPAEMIGIGIATVMYTLASHGRSESAPAETSRTG